MSSPETDARYFFHRTYFNRYFEWQKLRDVVGGSEIVKSQGKMYLPKPSGMDDPEGEMYGSYKQRAVFYPILERTLQGLTGIVMRHDPTLENLPPELDDYREAFTTDFLTLNEAIEESLFEILHMGRHGILVDVADSDSGVDPFVSMYYAEDITHWGVTFHKGRRILKRVMVRDALREGAGEDEQRFLELYLDFNAMVDGEPTYRVKEHVVQIRRGGVNGGMFTPGMRVSDSIKDVSVTVARSVERTPSVQGVVLNRIPFFFMGSRNNRPDVDKSPALDLADHNLAHYRVSAQYQHALFLCSDPQFYLIGDVSKKDMPTKRGAGVFWKLPVGVESVGVLESSGVGLNDMRQCMTDLKDEMAALGAQLLYNQQAPNETATAARLRGRWTTSTLERAVMTVEKAYTRALNVIAKWKKAASDDPKKKLKALLNRDFMEIPIDPGMIQALMASLQAGKISPQTFHWNLERGEVMPPGRTFEEEMKLIEEAENKSLEKAKKFGLPVPGQQPPGEDDKDKDKDEGDKDKDEGESGTGKPPAPPPGFKKPE